MPQKENYSLNARKGWLRLKTSTITLDEVGNPTFIGHRQSEPNLNATTKVDVSGLKDGGVVGITAYAAHHNHYDMQVAVRDGKQYLQAKIRIGEMEHIEKEIPLNESIVYLRITADPQFYHLLNFRKLPLRSGVIGVIVVKAYTLSTVERSFHASITFGFNSSNSFNFFNSKQVELAKLEILK